MGERPDNPTRNTPMNPNDLLFLTIPAAMTAFKLAFLSLAVVMAARSLFKPYSQLAAARARPASLHAPRSTWS
jgi:hypothetical protein